MGINVCNPVKGVAIVNHHISALRAGLYIDDLIVLNHICTTRGIVHAFLSDKHQRLNEITLAMVVVDGSFVDVWPHESSPSWIDLKSTAVVAFGKKGFVEQIFSAGKDISNLD